MKQILALVLVVSLAAPAGFGQTAQPQSTPEIAVLQLRVVEGEGASHAAGSRSGNPLAVQVTDETGRPVEGVTVSFRLPEEGVTGRFESGLQSEVLVTGKEGKVSVTGIRWGKMPGPVRIRITGVKGEVRGGIFASQYIAEPEVAAKHSTETKQLTASKSHSNRWLVFALVAAGAAAGGLALGLGGKGGTPASVTSGAGAIGAPSVGPPSIQVGKP